MSKFWKAYATVSDDVRHTLIEEGWYGRRVTGNIDEKDMPALATPDEARVVNNFYGETRAKEAPASDFYGSKAPAPETGTSSLYGNGPAASPADSPTAPIQVKEGPEPGY